MKNLKKTLAVVLAFAMILSMGFSAFAYTDVTAGTKVAEAVGILSNLNIFTGFEDGTFKPNDTVTRAQMAAIICRTLGYEDQAVASTGTTNFYDVAASHWASGYINVAESLQIVNGYGNGAFGPEDQVTYEQAIKMIVVALGYELDAQAKGGWSTGYLAVAAREGITKNSNGVVGTPAARGTIAVLVYNSLEVRLMDQWTWTPNGDKDEYGKLDET
ncbi:MAG: S-layer homology domain-containing protein, partial [Clostridia bacterium]|nr:S-layer homology domain-containing protein [Clostridia bacterium]